MLTDLHSHEKTVRLSTEGLLAKVEGIDNEGLKDEALNRRM